MCSFPMFRVMVIVEHVLDGPWAWSRRKVFEDYRTVVIEIELDEAMQLLTLKSLGVFACNVNSTIDRPRCEH